MSSLLRHFSVGWLLAAALPAASGCDPRGEPSAPYAVALARADSRTGARLAVRPGTVVLLDGSESGLAGGAPGASESAALAWRWRQVVGPKLHLPRADLARTECRPAAEGQYIFELVVSSGARQSLPVLVEVEVRADAPASPAETGPPPPPPRRPPGSGADFALLESDLTELIRVFGAKTGITLRVDPDWLRPENFRERPLTLMARNVGPPVALELAARLAGAVYVRDGKDAAYLTAGLGWLRRERQDARFYPAGPGLVRPDGSSRDLEELLRQGCRAALGACPDASIHWQPERSGLDVVGPESLHRRVRDMLAALASAQAAPPSKPEPTDDEQLREAALSRPVELRLVAAELSQAALDLGRIMDVPVAWEEPAGRPRRPLPRVSVAGRGRPAAEVLAEIEKQAGLAGHSWVRGGALWLYRTEPRAGCAESLWSQAVVRAYPAGWLEARGILPGAFVHAAKKRIRPETWSDPATLITGYKDTGRFLVIHCPEVQDEVVRLMYELTAPKRK